MNRKEIIGGRSMEKLFTTPSVDKELTDMVAVDFGNTGFDLCFYPKNNICSFDFMPEGKMEYDRFNAPRYSKMLCAGLFEFHKFLNNEEKISELGADISKTEYISATSNDRFINAMARLFSKSEDKSILRIDGNLIEINIKKYKNLKREDPLLTYLALVSEEANGIAVFQDR